MSKVNGVGTRVGLITIAAGIFFGTLPRSWIELSFHIEPDGGSGILEFFCALALVAIGTGILFYPARRCSGAKMTAVPDAAPLCHSGGSQAITQDNRA